MSKFVRVELCHWKAERSKCGICCTAAVLDNKRWYRCFHYCCTPYIFVSVSAFLRHLSVVLRLSWKKKNLEFHLSCFLVVNSDPPFTVPRAYRWEIAHDNVSIFSSVSFVFLCLCPYSTLLSQSILHYTSLYPLSFTSLHLFFFSLSVGMFSLSVVSAVSEVQSSSALLMFLFAYLLCCVFWNSPSLCTPAE